MKQFINKIFYNYFKLRESKNFTNYDINLIYSTIVSNSLNY